MRLGHLKPYKMHTCTIMNPMQDVLLVKSVIGTALRDTSFGVSMLQHNTFVLAKV